MCDNKDEMKTVLIKDILSRNDSIRNVLDSDSNECLEVVMLQKMMPSDNQVSYIAALKMTSNVRKAIYENDNKIFVSLSRCKVFDRYHILQCYHCQKPGHSSSKCEAKKNGALSTCMYCSDPHASSSCPVKYDRSRHCCSNCNASNDQTIKANAHTHTAASFMCPVLQPFKDNMKNKTENWLGKK